MMREPGEALFTDDDHERKKERKISAFALKERKEKKRKEGNTQNKRESRDERKITSTRVPLSFFDRGNSGDSRKGWKQGMTNIRKHIRYIEAREVHVSEDDRKIYRTENRWLEGFVLRKEEKEKKERKKEREEKTHAHTCTLTRTHS